PFDVSQNGRIEKAKGVVVAALCALGPRSWFVGLLDVGGESEIEFRSELVFECGLFGVGGKGRHGLCADLASEESIEYRPVDAVGITDAAETMSVLVREKMCHLMYQNVIEFADIWIAL